MNYKNITYKNKNLIRINSKKLDNILKNYKKYNGLVIYIAPINLRIDESNYWMSPFELEISDYMDYYDYINKINEIRFYNCIDELGRYLKYYIEM